MVLRDIGKPLLSQANMGLPGEGVKYIIPKKLIPVRLPPGRGMLETKPAVTGSTPLTNTMGTVDVARLAATAEETGVATRMSIFDSRSPAPLQEGGRNLHPPPHT